MTINKLQRAVTEFIVLCRFQLAKFKVHIGRMQFLALTVLKCKT